MFNIKYFIKYNNKYTNSCYAFFVLHNFKLKNWSYQWLKIIAGDRVTISCGWISLLKTSVCLEEYDFLDKRKRLIYWY